METMGVESGRAGSGGVRGGRIGLPSSQPCAVRARAPGCVTRAGRRARALCRAGPDNGGLRRRALARCGRLPLGRPPRRGRMGGGREKEKSSLAVCQESPVEMDQGGRSRPGRRRRPRRAAAPKSRTFPRRRVAAVSPRRGAAHGGFAGPAPAPGTWGHTWPGTQPQAGAVPAAAADRRGRGPRGPPLSRSPIFGPADGPGPARPGSRVRVLSPARARRPDAESRLLARRRRRRRGCAGSAPSDLFQETVFITQLKAHTAAQLLVQASEW